MVTVRMKGDVCCRKGGGHCRKDYGHYRKDSGRYRKGNMVAAGRPGELGSLQEGWSESQCSVSGHCRKGNYRKEGLKVGAGKYTLSVL